MRGGILSIPERDWISTDKYIDPDHEAWQTMLVNHYADVERRRFVEAGEIVHQAKQENEEKAAHLLKQRQADRKLAERRGALREQLEKDIAEYQRWLMVREHGFKHLWERKRFKCVQERVRKALAELGEEEGGDS